MALTINNFSTATSDQQCTNGFLNEESLKMIAEAPRNVHDLASFSFPGIPYSNMSMSFTQSGPLKRMVIAARFDVHTSDGWPELQIMRTVNGGIPNVVFTTNTVYCNNGTKTNRIRKPI